MVSPEPEKIRPPPFDALLVRSPVFPDIDQTVPEPVENVMFEEALLTEKLRFPVDTLPAYISHDPPTVAYSFP
jgi:hypothetical protein